MSIINELQELVAKTTPIISGRVESMDSTSIVVVSSQGVRRFWVPSTGVYKIGDTVRYQGQLLVGRTTDEGSVPAYSV